MVKPEEYIHYKNSEPFYEYENEEFASCLTGNHDVVYGSYDGIHKIKQSEILDGLRVEFLSPVSLVQKSVFIVIKI